MMCDCDCTKGSALLPRYLFIYSIAMKEDYFAIHISDINECSSNGGLGPCQQVCTNTNGSFNCSCQSGYNPSGYNCIGMDVQNCNRLMHHTHLYLVGASGTNHY